MKLIVNILLLAILLSSCGEKEKRRGEGAKSRVKTERKTSAKNNDQVTNKANDHKNTVSKSLPKSQLATADKLINATAESDVKAVDAAKIFKLTCAICHGRNGNLSINGSKILTETKTSLTERVAQIYFGKGTMTPYKGILKDQEIIAVAKYIDQLNN